MNMQNTGAFIRAARKRLDMTQKDLGQYLGVPDKTVSCWERGLVCPELENLKNMALLFRCGIYEIVGGTGEDIRTEFPENAAVKREAHEDVDVTFADSSAHAVSPLLFGDNLEHTRASVNGGISAEILRNRKFVGKPGRYGCAHDWYAVGENPVLSFGSGRDAYTVHGEGYRMNRAHERNAQYITNYAPGISGIGQKDLHVLADTDYEFTAAVRSFAGNTVTVSLIGSDRTVYDSKSFPAEPGEYREVTVLLHSPAGDAEARIEITFDTVGTVMIGALSMLPCGHFHGMRPDVIEKMKELGIRLLRWPGGNFAGEYHWKDGLLPRNMRAPFQSYLWIETQPHTHGYDFHDINTDDFVALCREIGAEPFLTLNPTWNTPEESAQWVEYCNGDETTPYGKLRAENGHPEPYNVHFWSLGNEMGFWHMEGVRTPEDYAGLVREHAEKMLEVSPRLTICSSGPHPSRDWAENSTKALADVSPTVSLHHYPAYPAFIDPEKRKEEYDGFIGKVDTEFEFRLLELRRLLGDSKVRISYDEWNAWYAWYRGGSVTEGIMAAAFLNMLMRDADPCGVVMACHFESVNEGAMQVFPGNVRFTPTGQAISLMKNHACGQICALRQDVTATCRDSEVTCTLLNRSYDQPKKFTLRNCGEPVSALLYFSDDVVPNTVFEVREADLTKTEDSVEILLPPHSIAQFRMVRK